MNILIFGPPGSGKSTHSHRIVERYGLTYISSGDMIRGEIEKGSELGREMERYLSKGQLIPDTIVNALVISRLRRQRRNFIIDGYPRTPAQVLALEEFLYDHGMDIDLAMEIFITEDECVERISGRRICPNCGAVYHVKYNPPKKPGVCDICGSKLVKREDDSPEIIRKRYQAYITNMRGIIKFYQKKGVYVRIDGDGGIEDVWKRIQPLLDYIRARESSFRGHPSGT